MKRLWERIAQNILNTRTYKELGKTEAKIRTEILSDLKNSILMSRMSALNKSDYYVIVVPEDSNVLDMERNLANAGISGIVICGDLTVMKFT